MAHFAKASQAAASGDATIAVFSKNAKETDGDEPPSVFSQGDEATISARVTSINQGEAIANVALDVQGMRVVASITVEAVRKLGIEEGAEVTAVIKASDVMIGVAE
jgi:molybdate transport system regulatory protein